MSRERERAPRVAIVGAGRAARAFESALIASGAGVRVYARAAPTPLEEILAGTDAVLLAVSDDALEQVATHVADAWPAAGAPGAALHLAGARSAAVLAPLARRGAATGVLHPVVALQGASSAATLDGARATVSGDEGAVAMAEELCRRVGLVPLRVADEARPLVHLAAVMAAGDAVALLSAAEALLACAGVAPGPAREMLSALARSAVDAYGRSGAGASLTGPVARGDLKTVEAHAAALAGATDGAAADAARAHRPLARRAAALALAEGRIDAETHAALLALLDGPGFAPPDPSS